MPFAGLERLVTLADENGNELICNLWMRSALIQSRYGGFLRFCSAFGRRICGLEVELERGMSAMLLGR
jgi:hypothetical protein